MYASLPGYSANVEFIYIDISCLESYTQHVINQKKLEKILYKLKLTLTLLFLREKCITLLNKKCVHHKIHPSI